MCTCDINNIPRNIGIQLNQQFQHGVRQSNLGVRPTMPENLRDQSLCMSNTRVLKKCIFYF